MSERKWSKSYEVEEVEVEDNNERDLRFDSLEMSLHSCMSGYNAVDRPLSYLASLQRGCAERGVR